MKCEHYLGIDIGGTSIKYGYVNLNGQVTDKGSLPTANKSKSYVVEGLLKLIADGLNHGIKCVGIACLGIVDRGHKTILGGVENMPFLEGMKLGTLIGDHFPDLQVHVINDARAAALGEQHFGEGKKAQSFFLITLGTGVGGVLVINGQVIEGAHLRAGEIGYLNYKHKEDYLEQHYATQSVMKKAAARLEIDHINGREFFLRIEEGCQVCQEVLDWWVEGLADLIATVAMVVDPDLFIIGGGVSSQEDGLIAMINQAIDERMPEAYQGQVLVKSAMLNNDAGLIGAVVPFMA